MNAVDRKAQQAAATLADARWARVLAKDASADGSFWYAVSSTGVYCRPSCAARPARPEHVRFFDHWQAAQAAGFRPCKRCHPQQASPAQARAALVAQACKLMEAAPTRPQTPALASALGVSASHFHRLFRQLTGLTPRAWWQALRAERMRRELDAGTPVTAAIYQAGYQSGSRFYEEADRMLGMSAARRRQGGKGEQIRFAVGQCALGAILVAQSSRGICAILLGDDPQALVDDLQQRFGHAQLIGGDAGFEQLVAQVVGLVQAPGIGLCLPLDLQGTAFQQRVWQALAKIPAGQTVTYAELAERIGAPAAVRAVGRACGANPLAVAIPCHRVVRSDGGLCGYRWGLERKRALLELEAQQARQEE